MLHTLWPDEDDNDECTLPYNFHTAVSVVGDNHAQDSAVEQVMDTQHGCLTQCTDAADSCRMWAKSPF